MTYDLRLVLCSSQFARLALKLTGEQGAPSGPQMPRKRAPSIEAGEAAPKRRRRATRNHPDERPRPAMNCYRAYSISLFQFRGMTVAR